MAGDIRIQGGTLRATGGEIDLISVGAAGEISASEVASIAAPIASGKITLADRAVVDVGGGSRVVLPDGEHNQWFATGVPIGLPAPNPAEGGGGRIVIRSGQLALDQSAVYHSNEKSASGGQIDIRLTGDLTADNGSHIVTTTLGEGTGAGIRIQANAVSLNNRSVLNTTTAGGTGRGGDTSISARSFTLSNGSQSVNDSFGSGDTGDHVVAVDELRLDGQGSRHTTIMGTLSRFGRAGNVSVRANRIEMRNRRGGSLVGFGSYSIGVKPAGDVDVKAEEIRMDGDNAHGVLINAPDTELTLIASVSVAGPAPSGNIRS